MKSSHSLIKAGVDKITAQSWTLPEVVQVPQAAAVINSGEHGCVQPEALKLQPFSNQLAVRPGDVLPARDTHAHRLYKSKEIRHNIHQWQPHELLKVNPEPLAQTSQEALKRQEEILNQARQRAEEIIKHASQQSDEIIQQAQQQLVETAQEARRQGLEEGRRQAEEETAGLLQIGHAVLEEARRLSQDVLVQSEPSVIDLVKTMAASIFSEGVALQPAVLEDAFQRAVAQAKTLGRLRIHLNPADYDMLSPIWKKQQEASIGNPIDLIVDDKILQGGCLIEGEYGTVDARLETKLTKVVETVSRAGDEQEIQTP